MENTWILQLYEALKNNKDINSVYTEPANQELINCDSIQMDRVIDSIRTNIEMLLSVEFEEKENKKTSEIIKLLKEADISENVKLDNDDYKKILVLVACRLVLFCVTSCVTRRVSTILDDELNFKVEPGENTYYRGHSNSTYKLIPSIYRDLKIESGDSIIINKEALKALYSKYNISDKYYKVFGTDDIDYSFCAFAQHSKAFSPFLDFTEEMKVALSFAVSNVSNLNSYSNSEAAVYSISFNDELKELDSIDIDSLDVLYCTKRINPSFEKNGKKLYYCTYKDFEIEAFVLKEKTNDRMKYQKGCFLYFQKAMIVNEVLLIPVNFGRISKYNIPSQGKTLNKFSIYRVIKEKYEHYKYEYMMNPYKFFEDSPF